MEKSENPIHIFLLSAQTTNPHNRFFSFDYADSPYHPTTSSPQSYGLFSTLLLCVRGSKKNYNQSTAIVFIPSGSNINLECSSNVGEKILQEVLEYKESNWIAAISHML